MFEGYVTTQANISHEARDQRVDRPTFYGNGAAPRPLDCIVNWVTVVHQFFNCETGFPHDR